MRAIGRALFLDLDGTVIVTKSGSTFPKTKDDWQFNGDILKRIDEYVSKDYFIMIVSNQGGIESGHVKLNDFRHKIRQVMNGIITETGCPLSRASYRFSMSNNADDYYRKPNPGMGYDIAMAYILDLSQCVMVGDASGQVRKQTVVYRDDSSPTKWSFQNGEHLVEKEAERVIPNGLTGLLQVKDHSDSDLKFALSCGMKYIDIQDFLKDAQVQ